MTVSSGWSGTATPSKTNYTFVLATRAYSNVTSNLGSQDYTGTLVPTFAKVNARGTANKVLITWQTNLAGFWVEFTDKLSPDAIWTQPTQGVQTNGDSYTFEADLTVGARFFRLRKL